MSELIKIDIDTSDSPWRKNIKSFFFDKHLIDTTCKLLVKECNNHNDYRTSYQYDKHVEKVMPSFKTFKSEEERKAFYTLVEKSLYKGKDNDWHDGAIAASRSLRNMIAYMTSSFREAKEYSDLYGS